jgi:hypothetical protein
MEGVTGSSPVTSTREGDRGMRQQYETQADLMSEKAVADKIATQTSQWADWLVQHGVGFLANVAMQKLPAMTYKLDWCVTRGSDIVAWAELKIRNMTIEKYPDVMLSTHKLIAGRTLATQTGVPFVVFIAFTDCLGFHVVYLKNPYPMKYGGRTVATRDPADIEPVCYMDVSSFYSFRS